MSITLELTPQEEEVLRSAAQETGQSIGAFLKDNALKGLGRPSQLEAEPDSDEASWERLSLVGKAAGLSARERANALDSGVVYAKDGAVLEELPDGTTQILYNAAPSML